MSTKNKTKPQLKQELNGLQPRIWFYFALFSIAIIGLVWVFGAVLNGLSFKQARLAGMRDTADEIVELLPGLPNSLAQVHVIASSSCAEVDVFVMKNGEIDFTQCVLHCNPYTFSFEEIKYDISTYKKDKLNNLAVKMINDDKTSDSSLIFSSNHDEQLLVYYRIIYLNGEQLFMSCSTPMLIRESANKIMSVQLLWTTIAAFVLALIASYLLSSHLSKPIVKMSASARQLAKGKYDLRFEGNGYNEIDELAETLNYVTKELEQTENLRRDVVANVTHDLKTPLTLIKSYTEMLIDFPNAPEARKKESLDLIIKEVDRITALVNDMVSLSLSEAGTTALNIQEFDLSALTESVAEVFKVKQEQGYVFKTQIEPSLIVNADREQIQTVLYNYISNAFAYTGEDKRVTITLKEVNGVARFDCFDTGCGLSPKDTVRIWDRFYRTSASHTRSQGTGLGLSIVRNIMQLHSAPYGVNSIEGKGSDFYFELKLVKQNQKSDK
ncbi:MAG: HAMP domain-containing sensor histidine kinase [Clostridia bacterium]